jgi:hypothetical protein
VRTVDDLAWTRRGQELKGLLSDPEWLDDPEAKADKVANECLRELRARE